MGHYSFGCALPCRQCKRSSVLFTDCDGWILCCECEFREFQSREEVSRRSLATDEMGLVVANNHSVRLRHPCQEFMMWFWYNHLSRSPLIVLRRSLIGNRDDCLERVLSFLYDGS